MVKLNICIDIDGTITDPYYFLEKANLYFKTTITKEQVVDYKISKVFNVTETDYTKFYEENKTLLHSNQELRSDALEIISILYEYHNIHFVTARDKSLELLTHSYISRNNLPCDSIHVIGTPHKGKVANNLKCDIFIEDSYDNALELSNIGFKVLLIDTNYNRHPLNNNITRVFDWYDIYYEVNKYAITKEAI